MRNRSESTTLTLLLLLLLLVSFGTYGQSKQDKIDSIVSTFKIVEMPQMQYKYRIEPLKFHATGKDSLKLIELENQLNEEDILKVIYRAFDEHLSNEEVDDIFNFMQSAAYEKMFTQGLIYKTMDEHYSYIGKEIDKITNNLDESIKNSKPGFEPIPAERADGFYLTKDSIHSTGVKEIVLYDKPSLTSKDILEVKKVSYDDKHSEISIQFTKEAAQQFYLLTKENKGKPLAIVLGRQIVSMPTINAAIIGGTANITGDFTNEELDKMVERLKEKE